MDKPIRQETGDNKINRLKFLESVNLIPRWGRPKKKQALYEVWLEKTGLIVLQMMAKTSRLIGTRACHVTSTFSIDPLKSWPSLVEDLEYVLRWKYVHMFKESNWFTSMFWFFRNKLKTVRDDQSKVKLNIKLFHWISDGLQYILKKPEQA